MTFFKNMPFFKELRRLSRDAPGTAPERPLVICDADEVLFRFVDGLERFLDTENLRLDLRDFRLAGNIYDRKSGKALPDDEIPRLLNTFFAAYVGDLDPVPGAAEGLARLAPQCTILVVSNLPAQQRDARRRALERHGMPYPVYTNTGPKGPLVARLAARTTAPGFFLDDLPTQLTSAAEHRADLHCIHFIGNPRLASLAPKVDIAKLTTSDWPDVVNYVERQIGESHRHGADR